MSNNKSFRRYIDVTSYISRTDKRELVTAIQFSREYLDSAVRFTAPYMIEILIPRCIDDVMTATLDIDGNDVQVSENEFIIEDKYGNFEVMAEEEFYKTYIRY